MIPCERGDKQQQKGEPPMKTTTAKPKKPTGRPPNPLPDRIPDTPENIMRALVSTPPKKRREWDYLKKS